MRKSKNPIVRAAWPKISDLRPSGMNCYMVDARPHGKREYFERVGEAKTRADQLAAERDNRGTEALSFPTEFRVMAAECIERLRPHGKSLREAVDHYLAWLTSEQKRQSSLLVRECVEQYIASRKFDSERGDLAKRSIGEICYRAKQLAEVMGGVHVAAVTPDTVKTYLDSFPQSARSRINIRLRMSTFFNFCKAKGWINRNPCESITIKAKRTDTKIMTVSEAARLLKVAQESPSAAVAVPYVALCLFAGLRPGEAEQLDWKQVHFDTETVEVLAHTSKTRDSRFVKMEPTLIEWLKPYAKAAGQIIGVNFRPKWRAVRAAAGYDSKVAKAAWVPDVMRHSYASYWLAIHKNRAELAELMGNSVQVIREHYRRPILEVEAKRYWAISA